jgi:hypothetical protein
LGRWIALSTKLVHRSVYPSGRALLCLSAVSHRTLQVNRPEDRAYRLGRGILQRLVALGTSREASAAAARLGSNGVRGDQSADRIQQRTSRTGLFGSFAVRHCERWAVLGPGRSLPPQLQNKRLFLGGTNWLSFPYKRLWKRCWQTSAIPFAF